MSWHVKNVICIRGFGVSFLFSAIFLFTQASTTNMNLFSWCESKEIKKLLRRIWLVEPPQMIIACFQFKRVVCPSNVRICAGHEDVKWDDITEHEQRTSNNYNMAENYIFLFYDIYNVTTISNVKLCENVFRPWIIVCVCERLCYVAHRMS